MTTKAFLKPVTQSLYRNTPVDTFMLTIPFRVTQDHGGFDNGPVDDGDDITVTFPLDTTPDAVYQIAYDQVLAFCATKGYDTPAKTDMYAWVPLDFSILIPDGPPAAMVTESHNHGDPTHGFLVELKRELKRQATEYRAKLDGNAENAIFIGTKPLMFDYFDE